MKLNNAINIVLFDGDKKALDIYGKLCRIIGDKNGYAMNIRAFFDTNSFLFEMKDSYLRNITDIIIIDPATTDGYISEVLRQMEYKGLILYLTDFEDFKLSRQAIKAKAFDLLMKGEENIAFFREAFSQALDEAETMQREYIILRNKNETVRLSLRDIYYFTCIDHIITAFHTGGKFEFRQTTMSELEARLSQYGFLRVHSGYLAAVTHIMNIQNYMLKMVDGIELQASRQYYPKILDATKHLTITNGGQDDTPDMIEAEAEDVTN